MEFIVDKSYTISCSSVDSTWNGEILVSNKGLVLGHTEDKIITGVYLKNHGIKLRVVDNDNYSEYYYFNDDTCVEKKDDLINKCSIKLSNNDKVRKLNLNIADRMQNMSFKSKCALLNMLEEPHMHSKDLIKR